MMATPSGDPWLLVALVYPLLSLSYGHVLSIMLSTKNVHPSAGRYTAVFLSTVVATAYLSTHSVHLAIDPHVVLALPGGVLLYRFETGLLTWATGRRIANRSLDVRWLLPIVPGAIAEEVIFREALSPLLATSTFLFVATSAVAFGALHLPNRREAAFKSVDGTVYATLYASTGTILAPILAHVGFNLGYANQVTDVGWIRRGWSS